MRKTVLLALALVLMASSAFAADSKIGYANSLYILEKCDFYKEQGASFEAKFKQREQELMAEQKELQSAYEEIKKQSIMLSQDARNKRITEFEQKMQAHKVKVNSFKREAQTAKNRVSQEIKKLVSQATAEYGKKKGYTLIIDKSLLMYADESLDVSDEILVEVNRIYRAEKAK